MELSKYLMFWGSDLELSCSLMVEVTQEVSIAGEHRVNFLPNKLLYLFGSTSHKLGWVQHFVQLFIRNHIHHPVRPR